MKTSCGSCTTSSRACPPASDPASAASFPTPSECMDNLFICHQQLREVVGRGSESFEVVRCTEAHRAYWRPHRVRVMLLAESHVFTSSDDLTRRVCRFPEGKSIPTDMPADFVRLVYCLGYGENGLLDQPIDSPRRNPGTPHFWKIFYSCVNRIGISEDFGPILVSRTPNSERIRNKVPLLRELQKRAGTGTWDRSYRKPGLTKSCALGGAWPVILTTGYRTLGFLLRFFPSRMRA